MVNSQTSLWMRTELNTVDKRRHGDFWVFISIVDPAMRKRKKMTRGDGRKAKMEKKKGTNRINKTRMSRSRMATTSNVESVRAMRCGLP